MSSPAQVFGDIYRRNVWGGGSGGGSDPTVAAKWCILVGNLIRERGIGIVLDIGCGDGRLASYVDWGNVDYIGVDCASTEARRVKPWSNAKSISLIEANAITDPLPFADLVLLKEVTQHLPNSDVEKLLERLDNYGMVLHCSGGHGPVNVDIAMGDCRPVDLTQPPFSRVARTVLTYGNGVYKCQLMERR